MTSISLRAYNREIESLIEGNQIEEAIAHCRHILERYPKHVATYRLLGKAYLENQRYDDAEDVLQRVLSCIPDDFIAHLGMSIIREESGDLEGAIWHMERAFDVQPSNAAIQAELRRLYGQRDGTPPVKVSLTRGALARMSARSHLYSQAIGELRAILAEDPQRPDLQVVLARLYFQTGQRNAAVETCSALLNRLPNCLEANRILAEVLPSTERASEAPYYKQRVEAIDPYSEHLSPEHPTAEQVEDEAVMLDRLVIGLTTELRPTRASLEFEEQAASQPEAIAPGSGETTSGLEEIIQPEMTAEEPIPDWMRSAGWVAAAEASGQQEGESGPFLEEAPEETEIPEWLRSLAPEEQAVLPDEVEAPEEAEQPDWLAGSTAAAAGLAAAALFEEEAKPETEERLEGEAITEEEITTPAEAATTGEIQAEHESLPDWLAGVETEGGEAVAGADLEEEAVLPEWLAGTQSAGSASVAGLGAAALHEGLEEQAESSGESLDEGHPQTISEVEASLADTAIPESAVSGAEIYSEDIPAIEAGEAAPAEELELEKPGEVGETEALTAEEEIPAWLQELSPPEAELEISEETDLPASEAAVEAASPASLEIPLAAEAASLAFLADLAPEDALAEEQAEVTSEITASTAIEDTTPDWLKELAGEQETPSDELVSGEELQSSDTIPDWLRAISGEPLAEQAATAEVSPGEEIESAKDEAEAEVGEGIPDWLQTAMGAGAIVAASERFAEQPAEEQFAEPPLIEGDTRPVRLFATAAEGTGEEIPETVASGEPPSLLEEQEAAFASMESPVKEFESGLEVTEVFPGEQTPEFGISPELSGENDEDTAPDLLASANLVGAAAMPDEQADIEAEVEEPSLEESAPPAGSLAEILAAAGAVYAADQIQEDEQPVADQEGEIEEPKVEELPQAILGGQAYEWVEEPPAVLEEIQPEEEVQPASEKTAEELPEWLREYETHEPTPAADMEETEWFASAAATGVLDAAKLREQELEGLLDLNAASQAQLERLPGVGFILAQNIVAFREQHGPFTSLYQLEQVPGISTEVVEELRQRLALTVVPESQPPASEIPELDQAWQRLSAGDIPGAIAQYEIMIQHEQVLDEVIKEIQQALALHPAESSLYQALGDAFMRADRLQEALEAYDRAEDLL